ncbi:MAG: hypothetical protein IT373_07890 [Polyangiaceae bacterium]|nr:hypothetical protein [Polyangiaceae bacterium]
MTRKERLAYIDKAVASHRRQIEALSRDLRRVPYLGLGLVLVVPAAIYWGVIGALTAVGAVLGSAISAFYIVLGHRKEREDKVRALLEEAEELGAREPPSPAPRKG